MATINMVSYFRPYGAPVGGLSGKFVVDPPLRLPRVRPSGFVPAVFSAISTVEKLEITRYLNNRRGLPKTNRVLGNARK
jgi:hypothetical protein